MTRNVAPMALLTLLAAATFSQWENPSAADSASLLASYVRLDCDCDFVEVPSPKGLEFGTYSSFTVEVYLKKHSDAEFNLINHQGPGTGWRFDLGAIDPYNNLVPSALVVRFRNSTYQIIQNVFPIPNGVWCHLAMAVDRAAGSTTFYIYKQGGQHTKFNMSYAPSGGVDLSAGGYSLGIGGRPSAQEYSDWFDGDIDEVRVWNRIRTEGDLNRTRPDTLGPEYYATPDSGLVLYLRFDELESLGVSGAGTDIRDLSAYGNHATLRGDAQIIVAVEEDTPCIVPRACALHQNYPNPFNPSTTISYDIPTTAMVQLSVFNSIGQKVAALANGRYEPGRYQAVWDASGEPSGVYFYRLLAGSYVQTNKMLLLK